MLKKLIINKILKKVKIQLDNFKLTNNKKIVVIIGSLLAGLGLYFLGAEAESMEYFKAIIQLLIGG